MTFSDTCLLPTAQEERKNVWKRCQRFQSSVYGWGTTIAAGENSVKWNEPAARRRLSPWGARERVKPLTNTGLRYLPVSGITTGAAILNAVNHLSSVTPIGVQRKLGLQRAEGQSPIWRAPPTFAYKPLPRLVVSLLTDNNSLVWRRNELPGYSCHDILANGFGGKKWRNPGLVIRSCDLTQRVTDAPSKKTYFSWSF